MHVFLSSLENNAPDESCAHLNTVSEGAPMVVHLKVVSVGHASSVPCM